jgi:DHA1 family multidrug resistance protein-like MFS transporter
VEPWRKNFRAIWIAEFLAIAGFATSNPVISIFLRDDLGVTDSAELNLWTGVILSAASLMMAIFAPIWGGVSDRVGRKPMLLRAMIGGTAITGFLSLAAAPWQVLALKAVQGCLTGTVAAATTLVASMVPEKEAGARLGQLQSAVFLGNFAGPLFGGVVTDLFGTRVNFLCTSAMLAAAAAIVWRFVGERFEGKPSGRGSGLASYLPDFSPLIRQPRLAALLGVVFAAQFGAAVASPVTQLVILSLAAPEEAGTITGLVSGATSLAAAVSAATLGRLSARVGYERTLLACLAGAALAVFPQSLATSVWALLAMRVASGLFSGGTMPSVNALISRLCEKGKHGATYGLSSSISSLGMSVGPVVGTSLGTAFGYGSAYLAAGCVFSGSMAAVYLALKARRPAIAPSSGGDGAS